MRDFKRLQQEPPTGISAAPEENNILKWNAVIFGYRRKAADFRRRFDFLARRVEKKTEFVAVVCCVYIDDVC